MYYLRGELTISPGLVRERGALLGAVAKLFPELPCPWKVGRDRLLPEERTGQRAELWLPGILRLLNDAGQSVWGTVDVQPEDPTQSYQIVVVNQPVGLARPTRCSRVFLREFMFQGKYMQESHLVAPPGED